MATIDVLLPVRNGLPFLAEAIDSIRTQTWRDWRLLLLDHGSTDGSLELAQTYQARDRRIEVHALPGADGLCSLLNAGLALCDCDYVMRHDADDIAFPKRMEVTLDAFRQHAGCVAIGGQAMLIDGAGRHIGRRLAPVDQARLTPAMLFRNPITHPSVSLSYAVMQREGIRYGSDFLGCLPMAQRPQVQGLAEDYLLFGQLALQGRFRNIDALLIGYRWHGGNMSSARFEETMRLSLRISRYLAACVAVMRKVPGFDPAPFCNHGGQLFDVGAATALDAQFAHMQRSLLAGLGDSAGLRRELAFRQVTAARAIPSLLGRYLRFRTRHSPETDEWNTVRAWIAHRIRRREVLRVDVTPDMTYPLIQGSDGTL